MKTLFEPTVIKGRTFRNRLLRSATWERLADPDGRVTPKLEAVYAALVAGGIGGIIVSATCLTPESIVYPGMIALCDETYLDGHRRLVAPARAAGVPILVQLSFAGRHGRLWTPAEATVEDLEALPGLYARAALLARRAGYDGAQIHCAHGYFLSQFLHPTANTRRDAYGGAPENRRRLLTAIHTAMRAAVGEDFLIAIKLDSRDAAGTPGVFEASLAAAKVLDAAGLDLVEVSGKGGDEGLTGAPDQTDSLYRQAAAAAARELRAPVSLVGGNRSPATMSRILAETDIAYFSLARPLLREPGLPGLWRDGDTSPSECLSCGGCYGKTVNRCLFRDD